MVHNSEDADCVHDDLDQHHCHQIMMIIIKNDDYHNDLLKKTLKEDSVVVADCQVLGVVKIPASNLKDEDGDVFDNNANIL